MRYIYSKICSALIVLHSLCLPVMVKGNVQVANLKQDLELISREVAGLRSEVELLRRENAQLRVVVDSFSKKTNSSQSLSSAQVVQLNARIASLEKRVQANSSSQSQIQANTDNQIQELIKQMNLGFDKVSKSTPGPVSAKSFSTDYPQKGFVHKVEKGETVSSIAKKYKSKVSWIINANQISDPTKVFVGKELFVPQN